MLKLSDVKFEYTGSKRGWFGNVVITDLDVSVLKSFEWISKVKIKEVVRLYLEWLLGYFKAIDEGS
jgi:hypothetical protein